MAMSERKGVHLAEYGEDLHLRLCIRDAGLDLRDKPKALLPQSGTAQGP